MHGQSPVDEFLLREYESAKELTFHVDDLRAKLTGYFITLFGLAAAGVSLLAGGANSTSADRLVKGILAVAFLAVGATGFVIVLIVARLRRVQFEHFRIMNNIREHVLGDRVDLWNVVELSHETLPQEPIRTSGSYFWVATIGTIGGFALGIGLYLTTFLATQWLGCWPAVALSGGAVIVYWLVADWRYMRMATALPAKRYSTSHAPKRPDVRNVLRQPCRAIVR